MKPRIQIFVRLFSSFLITSLSPQMPVKWMALECIHYRKFTHQSDVWSYGGCQVSSCSSVCVDVAGSYAHTCERKEVNELKSCFPLFASPPFYLSVYLVLCCSLFPPCPAFLPPPPAPTSTSARSDHLGADDIRRQAVRRHPHARNPRHSGEGGASAPAAHLHHRCLHGHGQM